MNRMRSPLVFACVALVALPVAPCAFLSRACCSPPQVQVEQPPVRSCCAHHEGGAPAADSHAGDSQSKHSHPGKPCSRNCCRISVFAPSGQKIMLDLGLPSPAFTLPELVSVGGPYVAPFAAIEPAGRSLQILQCRWRC